jgi:hypothetical protein
MRALVNSRRWAWTGIVLSFGVLLVVGPARADRPVVPAAEQADINNAIDQGVKFLKKAQLASGSWVAEGNNQVGYAALPALTLLECGVPGNDPVIKKAATFVRRSAQSMDRTYDLALTILFLDKLGEPNDEKLIQGLALRLVAGQCTTGGWSYKCPKLEAVESQVFLATLRKIAPGPSPIPLEGGPALAGGPANGPGLTGTPTQNPSSPGETTAKSPGETTAPPGATLNLPSGNRATLALDGREESLSSRRWAWCIKSEEEPPEAAAQTPAPTKPKPREGSPLIQRPLAIPPALSPYVVFQDWSKIELADPKDKGEALIKATTDNSNTQFAILGLWIAQRHDVPMERTLRLMVNRFQTSQNANGSWGYPYVYGGGPEGAPMTCVGLLGLAVGHGIAQAGQGAAGRIQDPLILNGFAALSKNIGVPAGRTRDLPLVNMYMLWSIERVAVLYNLPTIADKDWYLWGAEILVANQAPQGNWPADGGYPGQTPMANTCLALLFLRRANLVSDLTAVLEIKPDELAKDIADKVAPKEKKPPDSPAAGTVPPTQPPPDSSPPGGLDGKPTQPPAPTTSPTPAPPAPAPTSSTPTAGTSGGGMWLALALVIVAVLLLAAGAVVLIVHFRNRKKAERSAKGTKRKKSPEKRSGAPPTAGPNGKKPTGKTRLHS